jgi:integrase
LQLDGPWTRSLAEARSWRTQMLARLDSGATIAPKVPTVAQVAEEWLVGARSGAIRSRSRRVYKPSAIRSIDNALRLRVLPVFGREGLSDVTRPRLQRWISTLIEDGLNPSTVRNTLTALRVLYRHAFEFGVVHDNPTVGLKLPALERHEPRLVPPEEAASLLAVLPLEDRAIWATAFYAGLRRGELWGLRVRDVNLDERIIRVRNSEDVIEGQITPKSEAGHRPIPIAEKLASTLGDYLAWLRGRRKPEPDDRIFPGERAERFSASALLKRSRRRWVEAELEPVRLHDCRHTYASFGIAAGWNPKTLQTYMGHSSIQVTYDIYGHLFPGSEAEAAALLDDFLNRARPAKRPAMA